ncbi:MAG: hypothetical protein E7001_08975 [Coriobacteriaceae bacterium]|nr:hypothetical protein [Coriobacteriaceae bacterium]
MTLGQMLDGVDPDLIPSDQTMYEDLLWAFGAWDTLEEMNAAMATRAVSAAVCAHDTQAHDPNTVAPWAGAPWGARGRDCHAGSGRPDNLAGAGTQGAVGVDGGRG